MQNKNVKQRLAVVDFLFEKIERSDLEYKAELNYFILIAVCGASQYCVKSLFIDSIKPDFAQASQKKLNEVIDKIIQTPSIENITKLLLLSNKKINPDRYSRYNGIIKTRHDFAHGTTDPTKLDLISYEDLKIAYEELKKLLEEIEQTLQPIADPTIFMPSTPPILVSAGAVITNSEGEFLVAKRGEKARDDQGTWEFPGGKVLPMETREQAMQRNIKDKYGIEVEIIKELGVYDVIDEQAGDHWVSTTYLCRHASGEPQNLIPNKCDEIGWFSLEKIKNLPISRITKLNLKDIQ